MRILVTGASGQLGSRLAHVLSDSYSVIACDSKDLDITDFDAVRHTVNDIKPELVINCAAWTNVDGCAENPEKAIQINGYGAQNLAIATYDVDAAILQVSSNEVFDGKARRPYYEYDRTNPVNPYGYSKYVGEKAVVQNNPRHYIVRTSWLFAHGGRNFIHVILDVAQAGKNLRVVVDEVANPTYNNDLADGIVQLINIGRYGTYHLVNQGSISRYTFARYLLDKAGYAHIPIHKISHHEWHRPSTPPVYSGLANLAAKSLGIELRGWQNAVDAFLSAENLIEPSAETTPTE